MENVNEVNLKFLFLFVRVKPSWDIILYITELSGLFASVASFTVCQNVLELCDFLNLIP